jgi:hypothetical protein
MVPTSQAGWDANKKNMILVELLILVKSMLTKISDYDLVCVVATLLEVVVTLIFDLGFRFAFW